MKITSLFLLVLLTAISADAGRNIFPQPLSPRIANYDIDVTLDAPTRMLHGRETLTWVNKSSDSIGELQFHLYMNGFRNAQSTFMREAGSRASKMENDGWGFIDVKKITLSSGGDVTARMRFIHPDDDNANDRTVVRLPLPTPLAPGDSARVRVDFEVKLPQPPVARTGAKEEFFFAGQWFPKVGVYIDGKWNCHQFHANSEFFADFGVYNVRITVPEKNIVGATGLEMDVRKNGNGTATHFYHAEDVHDFAWTTSPEFVEVNGEAEGVKIRVLMQPDHAYQGRRHLNAAKVALKYFHDWYGTYPFPNLTIVDPRRGAGSVGGMEYPTLITAGTAYGLPQGLRLVEMVVIHEFGHQYWYHMVASNEFEESWLDEGINSYSETQVMHDAYGPAGDAIDLLGCELTDIQFQRAEYVSVPSVDPTVRDAWQYYNGTSYTINSYAKPALLLTTLQNYLGRETMLKVMRTYFERWRFKHPHTKDFIDVANEISGQNLNWYFDEGLFSNAVLDYSVDKISSVKIEGKKGYDAAGVLQSDTDKVDTNKSGTAASYRCEVDVRRLGAFTFPVEIEMVFENGEKVREQWNGRDLWKKFYYTRSSRLASATVDPEHKIVLDVNYTNNSKTAETQSLGVNALAMRFLFWVQSIFDQPDLLNVFSLLGSF